MDYKYYEQKINDVIIKCPIETGVEILVYNLLDGCIGMEKYALIDINRIWKKQNSMLSTEGGVSDIAIVSRDFVFKRSDGENVGEVYGFVEVKAAGVSLRDTEQIMGQMKKAPHFIYTNGIVWKYYFKQKLEWDINVVETDKSCSNNEVEINHTEFERLKENISLIKWKENI